MGDIITLDTERPIKVAVADKVKPKIKTNRATNCLMLPLDVLGSQKFLEFLGTTAGQVWFLLYAYIRRGKSDDYGGVLYQKYYVEQRKLVARFDQAEIAKRIGLSEKSIGCISKATKSLDEDFDFIKRHKEQSHMKTRNVYELGYLKDVPGKKTVECLYLIEKVREYNKLIPKQNNQIDEILDNVGGSKYFK